MLPEYKVWKLTSTGTIVTETLATFRMDVNCVNAEEDDRHETLDYVTEIRYITKWLYFSFIHKKRNSSSRQIKRKINL